MRQTLLRPQFVEFIPEYLDNGVLYISQHYRTATHRCCCGCGAEVVTPLGPTYWSLQVVNGAVTLNPSIGNWSLPCRSHYWISDGAVVWSGSMTKQQIERGRVRDHRIRENYFAEVNRQKGSKATITLQKNIAPTQREPNWIGAIWKAIKKLFGLPN